jgi:hypothetical protein
MVPDIQPELKEQLIFSALEKNRINNFVFLILKRWFPTVLDNLISDELSLGGDDASIINVVFAGVLALFVLIKKAKTVSIILKDIKAKNPDKTDLPAKYRRDESGQ